MLFNNILRGFQVLSYRNTDLPGFKSNQVHVRKLPVTWGYMVVFAGYYGFLHRLQLVSHELTGIIKAEKVMNKIPNSKTTDHYCPGGDSNIWWMLCDNRFKYLASCDSSTLAVIDLYQSIDGINKWSLCVF